MSFLKRAIREGVRKGTGDAVGKAVQQAIEPHAMKKITTEKERPVLLAKTIMRV